MKKDYKKETSFEDLNKGIENLDIKEIEFDFQNNTFEIETDKSLLKWSKSGEKRRKVN